MCGLIGDVPRIPPPRRPRQVALLDLGDTLLIFPGRRESQGLFERFLYQRDVQVTRYPLKPICCKVKGCRRGLATPRCYLSHVPAQEHHAAELGNDLKDIGILILDDAAPVAAEDYAVAQST